MLRRVLFFLPSLGGGGAESHALRLLNHLDRARYLPSVAVCRAGGSYEPLLRRDVPVRVVSPPIGRSSIAELLLGALGLARLLQTERPDVLCALMVRPSLVALAAARVVGAPTRTVVCVQSPPSVGLAQSRLVGDGLTLALRATFHEADRVIALTHGVARDLARLDARIGPRTTVIHNAGVDEYVLRADGAEQVPRTERPVVLAAGRLVPQKGYPYLLEAFARARRSLDAELWILGEGPERARLEAQIRALGIADSTRLLGFQSRPYAFLRRADLFVLSSLFEGFGNVIVEALASGAPVVATDCPYGPGEILRGERGGLLVPVADTEALAHAILRVLRDSELRARLVRAGRTRAADFHADVIARAYADEFDRIFDGRR